MDKTASAPYFNSYDCTRFWWAVDEELRCWRREFLKGEILDAEYVVQSISQTAPWIVNDAGVEVLKSGFWTSTVLKEIGEPYYQLKQNLEEDQANPPLNFVKASQINQSQPRLLVAREGSTLYEQLTKARVANSAGSVYKVDRTFFTPWTLPNDYAVTMVLPMGEQVTEVF